MFRLKKAIAFLLALIMVFSCVPASVSEDGDILIIDGTTQNQDVVLVLKDPVQLTPEDISVDPVSEDRLEALKGLIPSEKRGVRLMRNAKSVAPEGPQKQTFTGYAAYDISLKEQGETGQYLVDVDLQNPIELVTEENAVVDNLTCVLYHIHTDEKGTDELAETISKTLQEK